MTAALEIEKIVCRGCMAVLDMGDRYCRHCGAATAAGSDFPCAPESGWGLPSSAPAVSADQPGPMPSTCQHHASVTSPTNRPRWTESPWFVLPMVFLVLGPLGIPLLWRSRRITWFWKSMITIAVLALTALVGAMIQHTIKASLAPLEQFRRIQGL